MQYYDPYTPQVSSLQQQIHALQSAPRQVTVNGGMSQSDQMSGLQQQLSTLQNAQKQSSTPMQPWGTPGAMAKPTAIPSSMSAMPFANMEPGFGTSQGYDLTSQFSNPFMPMQAPQQSNGGNGNPGGGVGQYTNTITSNLPQSAINSSVAAAKKPVANAFSGALGQQLGDYTRATQSSNAVDLTRDGAAQQAKFNMANQSANANSGLNWSDLLARLNESAMSAKNAVTQPLIGDVLSQLLAGAF